MESYFPDIVEIPLDSNNLDDIAKYVHASVLELKKRHLPIELRQEIQEALIEGSSGMFLWVYLILHDLKTSTKTSPYDIRQKLKTLPKSLPELYQKILLAIKPEDLEAANKILRWVVWAERPLTLQELTMAIAIQPMHRSMSALREMVELDLANVLRLILGGLITIQNDTVYIVHQSAKEFLKEIHSIPSEWFSLQSNESNLHITIRCLTYLSFDEFENPQLVTDPELRSRWGLVDDQFYHYCSSHWSDHMKRLNDELQQSQLLRSAFLYLAQNEHKMKLAWCNFRHTNAYEVEWQQLIMATYYGLPNLIQFLLDDGADVNAKGGHYGNALQAAVDSDNEGIVRYLVERGADVNARGGEYGNALQAAAHNGNKDIVRYLVERGANVNAQGGEYGNALQAAAYNGDEDTVHYLVERGTDVNAQGGRYGTALLSAAYKGKENIIRYLVERGADINAQGGYYRNALLAAVYTGSDGIVRYLVERGADINAQGGYYGNALLAAAYRGNGDIVRYLVDRGADVNAQGGYYRNALQVAACEGKGDIVRYLVESGADVNDQGGIYGNALHAAVCKGNVDIVRYLVERGADINAQGGYYGNALLAAAYTGKDDIVRYLVELGADVNAQGGFLGNALRAAKRGGNSCIVDYLVGKGAV
jgi:ankyrin repeat protein